MPPVGDGHVPCDRPVAQAHPSGHAARQELDHIEDPRRRGQSEETRYGGLHIRGSMYLRPCVIVQATAELDPGLQIERPILLTGEYSS